MGKGEGVVDVNVNRIWTCSNGGEGHTLHTRPQGARAGREVSWPADRGPGSQLFLRCSVLNLTLISQVVIKVYWLR